MNFIKIIYKNKIRVITAIMLAVGIIMTAQNGITLINFKYFSYKMDELDIDTLHSGMCVSDDLTYTYGNIRAFISGMKTTYVYAVDVGSKHDMYMELIVSAEGKYAGIHGKMENLLTYFPGYYSELNSGQKVKMYGIVEKADKKTFAYEYFTKALGKTVDEMKSDVSTDYIIRMVDTDAYRDRVFGGAGLIFAGVTVEIYSRWKKKREEQQDEEEL